MGVAHSGYDQGGGAFTFKRKFFAQHLGHNIAASFFDLKLSTASLAQLGFYFFSITTQIV